MKEPSTGTPTGTVTFLFTDIEGSTRLWERSARTMQRALARHDEILRNTIEKHGGHVFKTVGDAFCCAFPTALGAIGAAVFAQRALLAEEWAEEVGAVKVRMALHTGAAEERGGDYYGPPVNRVARLLSAGHGGQVLLSRAAQELVRDGLPPDAELRDLGERRLKDLFRPERVFHLVVPDLPSAFPPLRTLDARKNNLPVQPTPLIGREREVAGVCGLLRAPDVHLLTLTGPGGTGKTRLGLQAAADLLDEFEGGTFFVALAPVSDPGLVASTIAGALGIVETPEQPLVERLKDYLRARGVLLLLDNFEQVMDAAPLLGELLGACPRLRVLVTSRVALRVYGEHQYAVPPLAFPDPARFPPVERLTQYEAVRLFVERARAVKADFEVTNENAPAVAEICARLDGLPLAIELAAARTKILPPQDLLERLSNRLKLLRGGARDLPERQRTLRGAIDWSHDLLDEEERTLFRRLSVFAGGSTLEAIEGVCDPEGELDALEGIESLVDKSLLRQAEIGGEPRFVMLETIHEYAREKLEESGDAEYTLRLHAGYFLALGEEADARLKGKGQEEWLERLETEHDNLRAALSWSLRGGDPETGLRIAGALHWFWFFRGYLGEGREWLEEALSKCGRTSRSARAKAMNAAAILAGEQGDMERCEALAQAAVTLYRDTEDKAGIAASVAVQGAVAMYKGDAERAEVLMQEGLALAREVGDGWGIGWSISNLGTLQVFLGRYERAVDVFEESLALARELEVGEGIAVSLSNLGYATLLQGDHDRAAALFEESLSLFRGARSRAGVSYALNNLGWARVLQGDHDRATSALDEALPMHLEMGNKNNAVESLEGIACVAAAGAGEASRAARLFGAAEALRDATGIPLTPDESALRAPYVRSARSRLGEAAWTEAFAEGGAMTLEEAVSYALEPQGAPDSLTGGT